MTRVPALALALALALAAPAAAQVPTPTPPPPGDPVALAQYAQSCLTQAYLARDPAWAGRLVATAARTACGEGVQSAHDLGEFVVSWCLANNHPGPPPTVVAVYNGHYASAVLGYAGGSADCDSGLTQTASADAYLAAAVAAYQANQFSNCAAAAVTATGNYNSAVAAFQDAHAQFTYGADQARLARGAMAPWFFSVSGIQWP